MTDDEQSSRIPAAVITVSDRCAAGVQEDVSGPVAARLLDDGGWDAAITVVPDEVNAIAAATRREIDAGARLVVTTGGTGVAPRDVTPEATVALLDREVPGVADAVRTAGAGSLPQAMLSRGVAGISGRALIVNLGGSADAVRDGIPVVLQVAGQAIARLDGA
ncbi:MogA/MoaB family molybdenum cofactor biosynthesis protein [Gordonia zhaorongruii]|uniref:MogA/MoaB family molybdenum cofactor biosynthesis protein n=1 Tax=Gordonia zhaorongruii TaxID=2597659 RepID=UPI00104A2752|nr:MogA/MoaB family molybdenum cofactor biosynthesis protein [Gordonia zhaorongruii]